MVTLTLAEVEKDKKLDKRHDIEDAMSAALIRRCPSCAKPYIKSDGSVFVPSAGTKLTAL